MKKPKAYGLFHIISILIILITTVIISVFFHDCNDITFKIIISSFSIMLILFEIIKQIIYTKYIEPKNEYKLSVFPFQFCSLALYVYPLIILLKDSAIRDSLFVFSSTFIFCSGLLVYLVPTTFKENIFLNIQTLFHHGTQIILGIFILLHEYDSFNIESLLLALSIFIFCVVIANIFNEISYRILKEDNELNLFYLSRHIQNDVPVLKNVYNKSYLLFLISYIFGFQIVGVLMYIILKYSYLLIGSI